MVKRTILHVEDDAQVSATVADLLGEEGYRVISAFNAEDGLRKLTRARPDLLLLDLHLPGMSGLAILKQIRSDNGDARVPILILTALMRVVDDEIRSQVDGVLMKPVDPDELVGEIDRILGERNGDGGATEP